MIAMLYDYPKLFFPQPVILSKAEAKWAGRVYDCPEAKSKDLE